MNYIKNFIKTFLFIWLLIIVLCLSSYLAHCFIEWRMYDFEFDYTSLRKLSLLVFITSLVIAAIKTSAQKEK